LITFITIVYCFTSGDRHRDGHQTASYPLPSQFSSKWFLAVFRMPSAGECDPTRIHAWNWGGSALLHSGALCAAVRWYLCTLHPRLPGTNSRPVSDLFTNKFKRVSCFSPLGRVEFDVAMLTPLHPELGLPAPPRHPDGISTG
jgi:hypothetical protein